MDTNILFIFILSIFVGFEVISKVPSMLHTPLMSGTNAIHGIILFGGILVLAGLYRGSIRVRQCFWRIYGHGPYVANV
jgi:NAD/NADP transhydrogenase alpha subunit